MMSEDEITASLHEIASILGKYDVGPLDYVLDLIQLWPDEPERFRESALDNVIWGGAGSLCDVSLRSLAQGDDVVADDRHFVSAIVRLGEALESAGLADKQVRERTDLFRTVAESRG